jgi:hypothetical protein
MYICEICRKIVPPHTPAHRVPVELRPRHYPRRRDANLVFGKRKTPHKDREKWNGPRKDKAAHDDDGNGKSNKNANGSVGRQKKGAWIDDAGGKGYEIVREVTACFDCAAPYISAAPLRKGKG